MKSSLDNFGLISSIDIPQDKANGAPFYTVMEELLKAACDQNQAVWTIANETLSRFGGNRYLEKPCRKQ